MATLSLKAKKRDLFGRKVKKLREQGILPANIYGRNVDSLAVSVDRLDFQKVFRKAGETSLVELDVEGKKKPTLIHEIQRDPVSGVPIHADFLQVDLKEKVTSQIPIELEGESPAEKQGLGTVVQYIDEVEVEALPTDLPERFPLDTSALEEVDEQIQIKDLEPGKKVEIKNDPDQIVVKVEEPREEEEEIITPTVETEAIEVEGEVAVETEGEEEEGEEPPLEEDAPKEQ